MIAIYLAENGEASNAENALSGAGNDSIPFAFPPDITQRHSARPESS